MILPDFDVESHLGAAEVFGFDDGCHCGILVVDIPAVWIFHRLIIAGVYRMVQQHAESGEGEDDGGEGQAVQHGITTVARVMTVGRLPTFVIFRHWPRSMS